MAGFKTKQKLRRLHKASTRRSNRLARKAHAAKPDAAESVARVPKGPYEFHYPFNRDKTDKRALNRARGNQRDFKVAGQEQTEP